MNWNFLNNVLGGFEIEFFLNNALGGWKLNFFLNNALGGFEIENFLNNECARRKRIEIEIFLMMH